MSARHVRALIAVAKFGALFLAGPSALVAEVSLTTSNRLANRLAFQASVVALAAPPMVCMDGG